MLAAKLAEDRRPPDGKLHSSGALTGSLRHLQLEAAGAPQIPTDLVSEVNLLIGTGLHSFFEELFRGKPVMTEVKLDRWMPEGWSGTADWIAWDDERKGFVLGDLKSCKPGAIPFTIRDGAKESHIWQVSTYWHALRAMGIPLVNGFCIYYLPKGQLLAREGSPVSPTMQECTPLPWDVLAARMAERTAAVNAYLTSLPGVVAAPYITDALAPVQERVQKLSVNKALKQPVIDVKLSPSWSVDYCPFENELCDCRTQKTNKVGAWIWNDGSPQYTASKDVEQPATIEEPSPALFAALAKAVREKASA